MRSRYFVDDCPVLEELLERHFEHMGSLLRQSPGAAGKVKALVLGGGYGRGEGGILRRAGDSMPALFNDLDYFLFTDHARDADVLAMVAELEWAGREVLGIDVDIKCLSVDEMGDPSRSMMFSDLVAGHHVVHGEKDYLTSRFPEIDPARIPPIEASRLLWNRGTGLYFAACRLQRREEPDFVVRNHAKFKLAAGDALLALNGQYAGSCRERYHRFRRQRPDRRLGFDLTELHSEGVVFKLEPSSGAPDWESLEAENRELARLWTRLFLHVESVRLGKAFETVDSYVGGHDPRSPEIPRWQAPLFALRDLMKHRRWLAPVRDYPRAALFRSLFCLLAEREGSADLPSPGKFLAPFPSLSVPPQGDPAGSIWEPVYTFWWRRYG